MVCDARNAGSGVPPQGAYAICYMQNRTLDLPTPVMPEQCTEEEGSQVRSITIPSQETENTNPAYLRLPPFVSHSDLETLNSLGPN